MEFEDLLLTSMLYWSILTRLKSLKNWQTYNLQKSAPSLFSVGKNPTIFWFDSYRIKLSNNSWLQKEQQYDHSIFKITNYKVISQQEWGYNLYQSRNLNDSQWFSPSYNCDNCTMRRTEFLSPKSRIFAHMVDSNIFRGN